jgi:glycosyltransferase involved in cell wall biosynthesis
MIIRIFTNQVAGGWKATDLDNFLGGSEECVVLLAEALVRKGFKVAVYHTFPDINGKKTDGFYIHNDVYYEPREKVDCQKGDILISFKDNYPWLGKEKDADIKIHWSSDIEDPWDVSDLDYFVNLSNYHRLQNAFVPNNKSVIVPHGIDINSILMASNLQNLSYDTMLYCSSPDRGLRELLEGWEVIHKNNPSLRLNVAYGFKNVAVMNKQPDAVQHGIKKLLNQPNVTYLGQLTREEIHKQYYQCMYWVLPLNDPTAELFCLNAVKAQFCGCTPIVNRIGALKETVRFYIDFKNLLKGESIFERESVYERELYPFKDWDMIVEKYWIPMFERKFFCI